MYRLIVHNTKLNPISITKCKITSLIPPFRKMIALMASNPHLRGEIIATFCMVGGNRSTGTQIPPRADRITIDIAPKGIA